MRRLCTSRALHKAVLHRGLHDGLHEGGFERGVHYEGGALHKGALHECSVPHKSVFVSRDTIMVSRDAIMVSHEGPLCHVMPSWCHTRALRVT